MESPDGRDLNTEEYLQKHLRAKKSMDLRNHKVVEEINKIRDTSTEEEILYGLQARDRFLQPSVLGTICKRDTERKQVIPVSRENTQCTCINITAKRKKNSICAMAKNKESLLAKIKLMTGEQMNILNNDLFNQEVESLKRRVEQVECTKTHEETVKTSLKKVSELERHMEELREEGAVPQSEIKKRKLEVIDTTEENHNSSEDFQAIASLPPVVHILPRILLCPVLAEEFEDPPQNPKTKRGSCTKCEGDWTVMDPYRN